MEHFLTERLCRVNGTDFYVTYPVGIFYHINRVGALLLSVGLGK